MSDIALSIRHVSKTFSPGTINAKTVFKDLNLEVERGDFITVIGSNGAGKSTMFGAVSGSFYTDSGSVILNGHDITLVPEYRRSKYIGRLFQDPLKGTAPGLSIEDNLALAAARGPWLKMIHSSDKRAFRDRLALLGMGLEDRMNQPVGLLSGGQRQALTLLMATFNPPQLLLLDEHTAALDPATAEKVLALTTQIVADNHLTCMMVTHNMKDALTLGNRTLMMDNGSIIFDTRDEERSRLTVSDLLDKFREAAGRALDNDRMLLGNS